MSENEAAPLKKKPSAGRTAARVIALILVLLVIAAVVYNVVTGLSGGVPKYFGYALMQVVSPSMTPDIPVNAYIIIRETSPDLLEVGDVITFYSNDEQIRGMPNTHRIAEITEADGRRVFVTRGTANAVNDTAPVYDENIIGRYVATVPLISRIGGWLRNPFALLLILVVPAFILFAVELVNLKHAGKEEANEPRTGKGVPDPGADTGIDAGIDAGIAGGADTGIADAGISDGADDGDDAEGTQD